MLRSLIVFFVLFSGSAALAQDVSTGLPTMEGGNAKQILDRELLYKVRFGSETDVHYLLSKGANIKQTNENGWPLVSVAASRKDGSAVPILRELVKAGADINQGGASHMFPVVVAARNGDVDLMNYLIDEAHADYNQRDLNGVTALAIAQAGGYTEIIQKIQALEQQKLDAAKALVSPERKEKLKRELIFASCAHEYMDYYFKSKQDPHTDKQIADELGVWDAKYTTAANDLHGLFHISNDVLQPVSTSASKEIFNTLEDLISNRNRREHNIGKPGDMQKRCTDITEEILPYFDNPGKLSRRPRKED